MNDRDIENMLRSLEGPGPREETTRSIMRAARACEPLLKRKKPARRLMRWAALAAAACACAAAFAWLLIGSGEPVGTVASERLDVWRNEKLVALGREADLFAGDEIVTASRADVTLADGSTVRLDKGTRLVLRRTTEGERARLVLKAGGIFLRVSTAPGEFVVTGSAEVRVLGTSFGVREADGRTTVNVIGGRVALRSGDEVIELSRGESAAAREGGSPAKTAADPNIALAWARDPARFENRPLGEVLDWISSNSTYRFDAPPEIAEIRVNVTAAEQPLRDVIEALALACDLKYSLEDHDVTMRR